MVKMDLNGSLKTLRGGRLVLQVPLLCRKGAARDGGAESFLSFLCA